MRRLLPLLVLLASCASPTEVSTPPLAELGPDAGGCALPVRDGLWQVSYVKRGGDCGELAPQTFDRDIMPRCPMRARALHGDTCTLDVEVECANINGSTTWDATWQSPTPAGIEGELRLTRTGHLMARLCTGAYDATAVRID